MIAPPYLKDLLHPCIPARTLRSQNAGLLIVPRVGKCTVGSRAFSYRACNVRCKEPDADQDQAES